MSTALAQIPTGTLRIGQTDSNVVVSWTGPGSLQTAPTVTGSWSNLLDARSPLVLGTAPGQDFFRVISRWERRGELLEANSEMAVAELDGKIYVIGGYPASRVTVRTVQVYDPETDEWTITTPLPVGVNHPMPAAVNGRVYIIGGQTDTGSAFVNNVYAFDPATTNWTARAPMPTARSAGIAAVIGDLIYVAGGRPPRGQDFAVYDTSNNTWTTLTNMPTQRNHIAGAAIGGKVYVAGGRFGAGFSSEITDVLEVYDPALESWSALAPMPSPRGGINGIDANGCFFVFGGEWSGGVFEEMEMYVPSEDRWYELEPIPTPVHGVTGAAYLDGWIHLPGGGTARGGSSGSKLHQVFWVGDLLDDGTGSP